MRRRGASLEFPIVRRLQGGTTTVRPGREVARRYLRDFPAPTPQSTPCRLAQGGLDVYGYGAKKIYVDGTRKSKKLHRWVIEQVLGRELAAHETVLHLCDNTACFRYDHLRVGTVQENNADMFAKGRAKPPPINRFYGEANPNSKAKRNARVEPELDTVTKLSSASAGELP